MAATLALFRKTASHGDIKKSAQKVADTKKDTVTRLKHLRLVLDNYETQDAKRFFQENYSHIYYIFYDNFSTVEADLKQRANKAHREELEGILFIFEKILFLLPEIVHKRWMFHSIGRVIKKLLHPGNSLQLRRHGMRFFLIWYQCLQENASEECHQIFYNLVPGLNQEGQDLLALMTDSIASAEKIGGIIAAGEITAILPGQGEKLPDNVTKYFLDSLLNYMVSEVIKIEWTNKGLREQSFEFLFSKFKAKYLQWLLPDFVCRDIFDVVQDLPVGRSKELMNKKDEPLFVSECRDSFIFWLANFTISSHKQVPDSQQGLSGTTLTEPSSHVGETQDDGRGAGSEEDATLPGSKDSTMSSDFASANQEGMPHTLSEYEIVRSVLYSTRENINIIHESFRQALLQSLRHTPAVRKVISVYKEWFQDRHFVSARPLQQVNTPSEVEDGMYRTYQRTRSYLSAVQDLPDAGSDKGKEGTGTAARLQRILQVFITSSANIFLLDADNDGHLQDQVELCKRVLNIYRHVVMNVEINQQTWEQLLKVLLRLTSGVLKRTPPLERHKTLGGRLAQPIFQTLIVTWTKANLNVLVTTALWDEFLAVLSSLTSWRELIMEWSKTMETLTRVLARQVYGLDLNDLPLERLSEQKEKRRRGKESTTVKPSLKSASRLAKSFSRGWSGSDSQPVNLLRSSTSSAPTPGNTASFERGTKYNSDGAGGKVRPDLSKQKSLSGDPSPSHSRCQSTDCLVRSSSEGNIVSDPHELLEKLRGSQVTNTSGSPTGPERPHFIANTSIAQLDPSQHHSVTACPDSSDHAESTSSCSMPISMSDHDSPSQTITSIGSGAIAAIEGVEVAAITTVCTAELSSVAGSQSEGSYELSFSTDKSDMEGTMRSSRTPSQSSNHSTRSKSGSRTPSPASLFVSTDNHKDSSTPDRDSLHIDIIGPEDSNANRGLDVSVDSLDELKSVMAGGTIPGWTPDVAVVLWQRMLGCLGDVNKIEDPEIHAVVFDALAELLDTLCRMSDNLGVVQDSVSLPPPELIPPVHYFSSWLFECLSLGNKHKRGKLMAYQLVCQSLLRRHEVMPSQQLLSQFYLVLHTGLASSDQDVMNVLVRDCGPKFFCTALPGCLLLTFDFIKAAARIISAVDCKEPPRAEAVTVLGSLLCYPYHIQEFPALEPETTRTVNLPSTQLKDLVINELLKAGKREPAGLARCCAVCSVAIFLYCELYHGTLHPKIKEAINVLLGALTCINKKVAKVATDMLQLLCDHMDRLLEYHPQMPKKITEAIASTISALVPTHGAANSDEEKRLIVSMMFTMVEWCLQMPMSLLIETTDTDKSCIYKVFRVLHSAVTGHSSSSLTRVSKSLSDFLLDTDFTNIWETQGGTASPRATSTTQRPFSANATLADAVTDPSRLMSSKQLEQGRKPETDIVKLAARALMTHLVNHLCHFPMGSGPARLHTTVQEHHDLPEYFDEDLKPEIFSAPNVQFFVLNHRCLISFIELPAVDAPGGGVTAGLMTARTVCRIIVRDLCGKYCWENSVLYSPPWCTKGSSRHNAETLLGLATGAKQESESLVVKQVEVIKSEPLVQHQTDQLPCHEVVGVNGDNLDRMLAYIGETSPECLLRPGRPLNIPSRLSEDFMESTEDNLIKLIQVQHQMETEHGQTHKMDVSMVAPPEMPAESQDPVSPFQMCRLLLDQIGLLSWEKRCHFDLLKKSDKILRELKNLDAQKCRETHKIAVIYIAQGQEDKASILNNSSASHAFEDFVAGLGWEVDLETHQGFMGGLQSNRTTGNTAPYWANSTCEAIFHVSTRIPNTGNDWHIKMRHIGNDEVHIVWSEHNRDYRRGIIPTEFGDIVIVIYPLPVGLYRIQIIRKPEVPFFGPLFDGAVVDFQVLPGLVRATAINASRLKRSLMPFYHAFYEERAKCLESAIQQHTEQTMFEDFAENVFAPVLPANASIADETLRPETSSASFSEILQPVDAVPPQMSPNTSRQRASDSALLDIPSAALLQRTTRRFSLMPQRSSGPQKVPPSSNLKTFSPATNTSNAAATFFVPMPKYNKSGQAGGSDRAGSSGQAGGSGREGGSDRAGGSGHAGGSASNPGQEVPKSKSGNHEHREKIGKHERGQKSK